MAFNRSVRLNENHKFAVEKVKREIKTLESYSFTSIEKAFRAYAKAHSAPDEMIEVEWNRFSKFLRKEKHG